MFLSSRDEISLEGWIIEELEQIKQKNPRVLAQYIISLIKQDKPDDELKVYCKEEAKVFLKDKSGSFIDRVFVTVEDGSYKVSDKVSDDEGDNVYRESCRTSGDDDAFESRRRGRGYSRDYTADWDSGNRRDRNDEEYDYEEEELGGMDDDGDAKRISRRRRRQTSDDSSNALEDAAAPTHTEATAAEATRKGLTSSRVSNSSSNNNRGYTLGHRRYQPEMHQQQRMHLQPSAPPLPVQFSQQQAQHPPLQQNPYQIPSQEYQPQQHLQQQQQQQWNQSILPGQQQQQHDMFASVAATATSSGYAGSGYGNIGSDYNNTGFGGSGYNGTGYDGAGYGSNVLYGSSSGADPSVMVMPIQEQSYYPAEFPTPTVPVATSSGQAADANLGAYQAAVAAVTGGAIVNAHQHQQQPQPQQRQLVPAPMSATQPVMSAMPQYIPSYPTGIIPISTQVSGAESSALDGQFHYGTAIDISHVSPSLAPAAPAVSEPQPPQQQYLQSGVGSGKPPLPTMARPHPPSNQYNPFAERGTGGAGGGARRGTHFRGAGNLRHQPPLPEHERYTLRCTGIPHYVKREDLRAHFESFGSILNMTLTPIPNKRRDAQHEEQEHDIDTAAAADTAIDQKDPKADKVFYECLVQFYTVENAQKCAFSPAPVLNNRFIHLHFSKFNLTAPEAVPPPTQEMIENDRRLQAMRHIVPFPSAAAAAAAAAAAGMARDEDGSGHAKSSKRKAGAGNALNIYAHGATNKYRRVTDTTTTPTASAAAVSEPALQDSDVADFEDHTATVTYSASTGADDGEEIIKSTSPTPTPTPTPAVAPQLSAEKRAMKEKFDNLKVLKQQALEILQKRETIIQHQINECRRMLETLESSEESDNKAQLMQKLEGKIVTFQQTLRTTREQQAEQKWSAGDEVANSIVNDSNNNNSSSTSSGNSSGVHMRGSGYSGRGGGRGGRGGRYNGRGRRVMTYVRGGRGF